MTGSGGRAIVRRGRTLRSSGSKPNGLAISQKEFSHETFGLEKELGEENLSMLRRALISRAMPDELVYSLGVEHTKGILLTMYSDFDGPPAEDIVKRITERLFDEEPLIFNVSMELEIKQKWNLNDDEISFCEDLKSLFEDDYYEDAKSDQQQQQPNERLRIVFIDDIELLGPLETTQVRHYLETQTNLLLFASVKYNRRHLIDSSLMRTGRLEIELKLGTKPTPTSSSSSSINPSASDFDWRQFLPSATTDISSAKEEEEETEEEDDLSSLC